MRERDKKKQKKKNMDLKIYLVCKVDETAMKSSEWHCCAHLYGIVVVIHKQLMASCQGLYSSEAKHSTANLKTTLLHSDISFNNSRRCQLHNYFPRFIRNLFSRWLCIISTTFFILSNNSE